MALLGSLTPSPEPEIAARLAVQDARRGSAVRVRGWTVELTTALAFLAVAVPMAAAATWKGTDLGAAGLTFAVYTLLLRVEFEAGPGKTNPGQLAVIALLFLLPPGVVPLVVALAQISSRAPELIRGEVTAHRAFFAVADAWFSVGMAAVVLLAPDSLPLASVVAMAFLAQVAVDVPVVGFRLSVGLGVRLRTQLTMLAWVYVLDGFLTPIAGVVAAQTIHQPLAILTVVPLAGLMQFYAGERRQRIDGALRLHGVERESKDRLQAILAHSADLIAIVDAGGRIVTLSGAIDDLWGAEAADAGGETLAAHAHPHDVPVVLALLADVAAGEAGLSHHARWRMQVPGGSWRRIEGIATNLLDEPTVAGITVTLRDVEAQSSFEEQLRHRAFHDELTGLPNKAVFEDRLDRALVSDGGQVGVLLIDLDDLKRINADHGRQAGDAALVGLAARLMGGLRTGDTGARVRGGTFAALVPGIAASSEPLTIARRILEAAGSPIDTGSALLTLSVSIGLAITDGTSSDADEFVHRAEVALRAAKRRSGERLVLWEPALGGSGVHPVIDDRQIRLREEILSVLDSGDALKIAMQPILDLRTGAVAGYEALSRFHTRQDRPPDVWFANAHRVGLGEQLEAYAIATALSEAGRPVGTYLAINVSPSAIGSADVAAVLPADLHDIVVEVTENELVSGGDAMAGVLDELRSRGARLAVDDVGAGYAGLQQLVRLQPDLIKLDRTLVTGVDERGTKAALILSLVRYASNIGASVCAEGIETLEELRCLADLGVDYGQGWSIARPEEPWATISAEAKAVCDAAREGAGAWIPGEQLNALCADLGAAASPAAIAASLPRLLAITSSARSGRRAAGRWLVGVRHRRGRPRPAGAGSGPVARDRRGRGRRPRGPAP